MPRDAQLGLDDVPLEALRTNSPEIEVEDSLTAFAKGLLGYDPNGREIRLLKSQLGRLLVALIRLAVVSGPRPFQIDTKVVGAFDLWFPKDDRQRVLWPSTVRLSLDYFESLKQHAVPLDRRAQGALSHNAMALDVYAWLAQRLHRVPQNRPAFVVWKALKDQFGQDYGRMDNFKRVFRQTLKQVLSQYTGARIEGRRPGPDATAQPATGAVPPFPGHHRDEARRVSPLG